MNYPSFCLNRRLRVIAYTDSAGIGGAEISLGHLVANASKDIDITVIGVSQKVVDAIANHQQRIVLPPTLISHLTTFHRLRPDIIHINTCTPWECAIGLFAALTLPQTRVVRVDQLPLRTTDAIKLWRTRALSLRVDARVAVGEASARRMEDFFALGRNSVISVPNCVPDITNYPTTQRIIQGGTIIGSVGRLDAMKGHDLLIRAIAKIEGVQVVILGEGGNRGDLEKLAEELGVRDRLHLLGWVDNPRTYLPQFDIFAMPSRSEGFPLALVEAMLAGLPVVATRVGSIPEAVIDEQTGLLVNKDDVDGLASSLLRLRDDLELRSQLGQCGRKIAKSNFTVEQMVKRYEQLWRELANKPQNPRLWIAQPKE